MTDGLLLLSNTIAAGVRAAVCLFLISRLLTAGKPEKKSVAAALAGAAVISIIISILRQPEIYRMILETVWIAFCASRLQKADARLSLFLGIFYEMAVSFWQFLFAAWAGVLFRQAAFLDYGTGNGQLAVWLLHAVLIAFVLYLSARQTITGKEAFRKASVIVVAGFLAVISLSAQTMSVQAAITIEADTLTMWTMLSVVLMISVLAFNMNRQYEAEKELARLKSEQAELLERDYTTLNNAYAMNARLFHDFHNHIGVLRQLLSHKRYEEAVQYLDELQSPVREMADTVWTGDETVDYLINNKAAAAKAGDISFQAQVEFPRHTNIRGVDLCAVLGNLLDNALEAAGRVPEPEQRFIKLTVRRVNQMLVIKVENSFHTFPVKEEGELKTTKENNGLHGFGLKSVQTAAEKYDGMVQSSYQDGIFRAVVTLFYDGVVMGE